MGELEDFIGRRAFESRTGFPHSAVISPYRIAELLFRPRRLQLHVNAFANIFLPHIQANIAKVVYDQIQSLQLVQVL